MIPLEVTLESYWKFHTWRSESNRSFRLTWQQNSRYVLGWKTEFEINRPWNLLIHRRVKLQSYTNTTCGRKKEILRQVCWFILERSAVCVTYHLQEEMRWQKGIITVRSVTNLLHRRKPWKTTCWYIEGKNLIDAVCAMNNSDRKDIWNGIYWYTVERNLTNAGFVTKSLDINTT